MVEHNEISQSAESTFQAAFGPMLGIDFEQLARQCERIANEHGWWEKEERNMGELLMLVTTEIAEAYEEIRNNHELDLIYYTVNGVDYALRQDAMDAPLFNPAIKPEGFMVEIADVLIRLLDFIEHYKLTPVLIHALRLKLAYNETRPYRHGNKAS